MTPEVTLAVAGQPVLPDMSALVAAVGLLLAAVLVTCVAAAVVLVARFVRLFRGGLAARERRLESGTVGSPARSLHASGGTWRVEDPAQLVVAPNEPGRIRIEYTPSESLAATDARAVLRARETWWIDSGEPAAGRVAQTRTLLEVPATVDLAAGQPTGGKIVCDVEFSLPGDVPSTSGDLRTLACDWVLALSVTRPSRPAALFEQPIIVTQPRERLNAGVVEEAEFSRYEQAAGVSGPLRVDFRVRPTPLDLATPAVAELAVTNSGDAILGREVRLEVRMDAKAQGALSDSWTIWRSPTRTADLPPGSTRLRFDIPAIDQPCPDADLPHGRLRGKLRFVVDAHVLSEIAVERDLCLCLDKPAAPVAAARLASSAARPATVA